MPPEHSVTVLEQMENPTKYFGVRYYSSLEFEKYQVNENGEENERTIDTKKSQKLDHLGKHFMYLNRM